MTDPIKSSLFDFRGENMGLQRASCCARELGEFFVLL